MSSKLNKSPVLSLIYDKVNHECLKLSNNSFYNEFMKEMETLLKRSADVNDVRHHPVETS